MSEANEKPDNGLVQSLVSPDGVQGIKSEPQSRDVSPAVVLEVLETIIYLCCGLKDQQDQRREVRNERPPPG